MIISLLFGLILGALSIIFIFQNTTVITINFLNYHLDSSLALIIFAAILTGLIIALLFSIPEVIKNHGNFSTLKNRNKKLEEELALLKSDQRTNQIQKTVIDEHLTNTEL
jgi:uncharacterized integral membrane protein